MNKILIFAGIILFIVLLLTTWFFIGEIGNFAQFLGGKSQEIIENGKSNFIGTWETDGGSDLRFLSDNTVVHGMKSGIFEIKDDKLIITYSDIDSIEDEVITYDYSFSDNENTLTLSDIDTGETTVYTKKQTDMG